MQRTPKHDKLFFLSLLPFASILIAIFMFLFYFLYEKSIPRSHDNYEQRSSC
ncbi:hypothetical protein IOK49_04030 [Fervidicoccus fontis]|uniref:Uncharacterized protein n=1 Tax=Fervidicoccus fontis TaxID=683846 RepID=A0A843ABP0_9CREN|nr:hypothetical protein [Fervidicoccus fontis]MBE9391242.1 hypothetical protein [Fervidicoccus fontis]